MHSKRRVRLYTWIAGIAFVGFDIAVAAWGVGRTEAVSCPAPAVRASERPVMAAVLLAPGLILVRDDGKQG